MHPLRGTGKRPFVSTLKKLIQTKTVVLQRKLPSDAKTEAAAHGRAAAAKACLNGAYFVPKA
jgi:hypothetical protein